MTGLRPYTDYEDWHGLLDALCLDRGHFDNAGLAAELCSLTGSKGRSGFETAVKNLSNWRRGAHVPHRRNFAILTKLLGVDGYDGLRPCWNRLYVEAKSGPSVGAPAETEVTPDTGPAPLPLLRPAVLLAWCLAFAGLAAGGYFLWRTLSPQQPAPAEITVFYRPSVSLAIGESLVIHGMRADVCGDPPPDWQAVLRRFPLHLETGRLSDGGVGVRASDSCGMPTPVRAVTFTATDAGVEEIRMFGDPIRIEVARPTAGAPRPPGPAEEPR